MYHTAYIPKHNYSLRENEEDFSYTSNMSATGSDSHKVFLLKQYILQLELHIAYLEKQLEQIKSHTRSTQEESEQERMLYRSQKKELIQDNIILEEECMIKEEELLLVIENNILLKERLKNSTGEEKNKTIQMLVEINKKLQEVNLQTQKQIQEYTRLQVINAEIRLQMQGLMRQCQLMKQELFQKRHVYSKFKLCLNDLNALQIKYKKFDPLYKSSLGYNSCI